MSKDKDIRQSSHIDQRTSSLHVTAGQDRRAIQTNPTPGPLHLQLPLPRVLFTPSLQSCCWSSLTSSEASPDCKESPVWASSGCCKSTPTQRHKTTKIHLKSSRGQTLKGVSLNQNQGAVRSGGSRGKPIFLLQL